jgi:alpha-galactosidase
MEPISRRAAGKILLGGSAGLILNGGNAWGSPSSAARIGEAGQKKQVAEQKSARTTAHDSPQSPNSGRATGTQVPEWSDVVVVDEPTPTISYRTGWVTYEESLLKGQLVGRGWNDAGYINFYDGRTNPEEYSMPEAFRLQIDGQSLVTDWQWRGLEKTSNGQGNLHTVITLEHGVRPISVAVHTKLDGTPVITRWLEVTNHGKQPAALASTSSWSGVLRKNERWRSEMHGSALPLYSLGYFDGAKWGEEGNFHWHDMPAAGYQIAGRFARDRWRHPIFMLRNNATGEFFIGQLAWTGGYSFNFDLDTEIGKTAEAAALTFSAGPDAPAPLRVIAPGEKVTTPEMHLGLVFGDLDAAVQAMHTHLRRSVFLPQTRGRGGLIETGIGPELEITPEQVNHAIDEAVELGAEVFFIDASWYAPPHSFWWSMVGDWSVNRQRFPQGLDPFRERVHAAGMLWGLWMDAERIGDTSRIAQDHPDWLAMNYDGERKIGGQLDLTNPEAAKWMESEIGRVIEENKLGFFRLDYNTGLGRGIKGMRDGFVENGYWRYYENLYAIYGRLRQRFPDVIFENCAGGGARTDIGMVRWFHHTDVTDWQIAPRSFMITNGMSMALPPESVDRLLGGQSGQTAADFDFQSRLLLFVEPKAGFLYPLSAQPNPVFMARARHWVDLYKHFVRPFVSTSRIYHHTPEVSGLDPSGWGVLELGSDDRARGICGVFQLSAPKDVQYQLHPRGLDISRRYRVTFDNLGQSTIVDGYALVEQGIQIRLEGALTSELLIFEAVT